ncbi:MAG: hypothetical protein O7B35_05220, partial [Deltaproteobacteria bacterium]|nr:hypothetical protein [Deltaproteobacteria bacterium]
KTRDPAVSEACIPKAWIDRARKSCHGGMTLRGCGTPSTRITLLWQTTTNSRLEESAHESDRRKSFRGLA